MFRRREKPIAPSDSARAPADIYLGLRNRILYEEPAALGLGGQPLWGFLMETGYPNGTATLVCLLDGTTSLYTSTGGGIIGGGGHEAVARANAAMFATLAVHTDEMTRSDDTALPREGETIIRALTADGQRVFAAQENDLGVGRSVMSPVFHAAHAVITELRKIDEARA